MKSSAALPPSKTKFGGQKSLFQHPAGKGKCPQSHLHRLHHHLHRRLGLPWWGGSSSPPRMRALPVAMWFISLSHGVIFMWSWALYLVKLVDVTPHLLCYSSDFIIVISGDTLSHDVKVTVCALCVSLRLNFTGILIMSYDLSWMSLWIVVVCLELSSALKMTVWGNLDWGMQTLGCAFVALHMISVCYPTRE
jgi:hypothetical protein